MNILLAMVSSSHHKVDENALFCATTQRVVGIPYQHVGTTEGSHRQHLRIQDEEWIPDP